MRADASVTNGDTPLAALMRETAAATADTVLAELRRRPIVHPEWLSLQGAAAYTGFSEQQSIGHTRREIGRDWPELACVSSLRIPAKFR